MRTFQEIQSEWGLLPFAEGPKGSLYCVPVRPGAPRWLVRRFDRSLAPESIAAYVELLAAAKEWVARDPVLTKLVEIEQPVEIGRDFIARRHINATSLEAYLSPDLEAPGPEQPDELAPMQSRFRALAASASSPQDKLLVAVLARSLLEPTRKTMYSSREEHFVIADLRPTAVELSQWSELTRR